MITISQRLLEEILRHAARSYPEECCGILVGSDEGERRVERVFPAENSERKRRHDRYAIDTGTFLKIDGEARAVGWDILGFYHSHPRYSFYPSETDRLRAWHGYSYLIVAVPEEGKAETRSWVLDRDGKGFQEELIRMVPNRGRDNA